MQNKWQLLLLVPMSFVLGGCPVFQSQDTPVPAVSKVNPESNYNYWIYVPSYYNERREWPLVITFHGTYGFDSSQTQINEWKALAEEKGLIVVAPYMQSVQGIVPTFQKLFFDDLASDEAAVLAIINEVCTNYKIGSLDAASTPTSQPATTTQPATATAAPTGSRKAILLTGFSAGGYPLYYIGLRHPEVFSMLIARSCNSDIKIFEKIPLTPEARKMPIVIIWGRDDTAVVKYSWRAVEWLSNHKFTKLVYNVPSGGHLRRPELAYKYWRKLLPQHLLSPN